MAEIKSTLDMVLARAAKMCDASNTDESTDYAMEGMRFGASFLKEKEIDITRKFSSLEQQYRNKFLTGLTETFLRNLVLPREDEITCHSSLNGLLELAKATAQIDDIGQFISEIQTILTRYIEHRNQLKTQLKEHFTAQMAQMEQSMAQQTGMNLNLDPANHPKFAEEWQKLSSGLQEQYGNPLEQYKGAIKQAFLSEG